MTTGVTTAVCSAHTRCVFPRCTLNTTIAFCPLGLCSPPPARGRGLHNLPWCFTHRSSTRKSQKYSTPPEHHLHGAPPPSPHPLPPTVKQLLKKILVSTREGEQELCEATTAIKSCAKDEPGPSHAHPSPSHTRMQLKWHLKISDVQ